MLIGSSHRYQLKRKTPFQDYYLPSESFETLGNMVYSTHILVYQFRTSIMQIFLHPAADAFNLRALHCTALHYGARVFIFEKRKFHTSLVKFRKKMSRKKVSVSVNIYPFGKCCTAFAQKIVAFLISTGYRWRTEDPQVIRSESLIILYRDSKVFFNSERSRISSYFYCPDRKISRMIQSLKLSRR